MSNYEPRTIENYLNYIREEQEKYNEIFEIFLFNHTKREIYLILNIYHCGA